MPDTFDVLGWVVAGTHPDGHAIQLADENQVHLRREYASEELRTARELYPHWTAAEWNADGH